MLAVAAFAAPFAYRVASDGDLYPGGFASTDGEANRSYNVACRSGNSGQMSVSYWHLGNPIHNSGVKWTNCPEATVALNFGGYYMSRCTNEGTVAFPVVCETTRP